MLKTTTLLALAAALGFGGAAEAQTTLKTVQDRGSLICGVNQGLAGFAIKDDKGQWSGFDVDFCRALAAAIFNDPSNSTESHFRKFAAPLDLVTCRFGWTANGGQDGVLDTIE